MDTFGESGNWSEASAVIDMVALHYRTPRMVLLSSCRTGHVAMVRAIAIYLMRSEIGLSYSSIGAHLHRDHSTIIHAMQRITALMDERPRFAAEINRLSQDFRLLRNRAA